MPDHATVQSPIRPRPKYRTVRVPDAPRRPFQPLRIGRHTHAGAGIRLARLRGWRKIEHLAKRVEKQPRMHCTTTPDCSRETIMFQPLEPRLLLSVVTEGRVLRIDGTPGNDVISV